MTPREREHALLAVLFTDIVGSSELAAQMGDEPWKRLLRRHHDIMRGVVRRNGGRIVDTAGDGVFAVFPRPAAAIACGVEAIDALRAIGVEIRAGIHFGETESSEGRVSGIVVHTAARVMALAAPGETLISRTVRDLVAGKRISIADRGSHELKGIPSRWDVFVVEEVEGRRRPPPIDPGAARALRERSSGPQRPRRRLAIVAASIAALVVAMIAVATFAGGGDAPIEPVVASTTLIRIDEGTNDRRRAAVGDGVTAIALGEGSVWLASFGDLSVYRVDPETLRVEARITMSEPPLAIAVGSGSAWVTTATTLLRVDARTDAVVDRIALGPCGQSTCPTDVAVAGGTVWATHFDSERLVTVDAAGHERRRHLASWPVALSVGHGAVWILHEDRPFRFLIERIDVRSGVNSLTFLPEDAHEPFRCLDQEVGSGAEPCADIVAGRRAVWVATPDDDVSWLWSFDGRGDRLSGEVDIACCAMSLVASADVLDTIWIGHSSGDLTQVVEVHGEPSDDGFSVGQPVTDVAFGYGSMWISVDSPPA